MSLNIQRRDEVQIDLFPTSLPKNSSPLSNIPLVHGSYVPNFAFRQEHMFKHMTQTLRKRKREDIKPLIRIYIGGAMTCGQTHIGLFDTAMENVGMLEKGWTIERLSIKDIREKKLDWDNPSHLVDWLLQSDIHVILIQGLHQGMIEQWHPSDCQREIRRLECHPGFPSGNHLQCPVFNADKKHYLLAIPTMTNPSFFFPLGLNQDKTEKAKIECMNFMRNNKDGDEPNFILKMPMVQNSKFPMRYIKNYWLLDPIIDNLKNKASRCFNRLGIRPADRFRYAIIQPFIKNHRETKVILFDGIPQYCCSSNKGGVLGVQTKAALFDFVHQAWAALKTNTNGAFLGDGITRFDVMVNAAGEMKINEVDNVGAAFYKLGSRDAEAKTRQWIVDYYSTFLRKRFFWFTRKTKRGNTVLI